MNRSRVLVIQHDADDDLKLLAQPLINAGLELATCNVRTSKLPTNLEPYEGLVVLGAIACLSDGEHPPWLADERRLLELAIERSVPTLGICFGAQHLALAAGGSVSRAPRGELGWCEVKLSGNASGDALLSVLPRELHAFQWHYDAITIPSTAVLLAEGGGFVQAFRVGPVAWGLQFHLEVDPGAILSWWGSSGRELEAVGVELARLTAECYAFAAANAEHAVAVAGAFARLVG